MVYMRFQKKEEKKGRKIAVSRGVRLRCPWRDGVEQRRLLNPTAPAQSPQVHVKDVTAAPRKPRGCSDEAELGAAPGLSQGVPRAHHLPAPI